LKPDYVAAHINYALLLSSNRMAKEAELHFQKALELEPQNVQAHKNYLAFLKSKMRFLALSKHKKKVREIFKKRPELMKGILK